MAYELWGPAHCNRSRAPAHMPRTKFRATHRAKQPRIPHKRVLRDREGRFMYVVTRSNGTVVWKRVENVGPGLAEQIRAELSQDVAAPHVECPHTFDSADYRELFELLRAVKDGSGGRRRTEPPKALVLEAAAADELSQFSETADCD